MTPPRLFEIANDFSTMRSPPILANMLENIRIVNFHIGGLAGEDLSSGHHDPPFPLIGFLLWEYMKGFVYENPVTSAEDDIVRVVNVAAQVDLGQFERSFQPISHTCEASIVAEAKNFEHLL